MRVETVLKKTRFSLCLVLIVVPVFLAGCSDLTDLIPGFSKPKETKEQPRIHKLKPTDELRSSAPAGGPTLTPSAVVPIGDETKIPGKPTTGGPVIPGKNDKGTPPVADKTKPAPDKGEKKKGVTPETTKETKTPPSTPAPAGTPEKGGGATVAGEDIAIVTLAPVAGAPTLTPDNLTGSLMDKEYIYDPTGKRDPFRPFTLKVEKKAETPVEELTPLQRYNLSQLKLTAIIYDPEKETGIAMVEAPDKKGYNIIVGSEIGGGKVVRITDTEVQVEVGYEDFYGNVEKRIETLKIKGGS
jgi:type IV pilus assembly protein PilP